jgi:uncharacterized protein (TIGR03086 family)
VDILDLDQRALAGAARIVAQVTPGQLAGPTPCQDWTLADLLAHMVAHNNGFAAAAAGAPAGTPAWDSTPLGDDPPAAFRQSAAQASAAFAAPGALSRQLELPGLGTFGARTAISFHFVDYLIHGWDVARAIRVAPEPDPELVAAALSMVSRYPDSPEVRGPGAPFGPKLPVPDDAPPLDRLVGLLGRSPSWAPA